MSNDAPTTPGQEANSTSGAHDSTDANATAPTDAGLRGSENAQDLQPVVAPTAAPASTVSPRNGAANGADGSGRVPASDEAFGNSPYADHVGARLMDFFGETTPWPRRLWDTGTVLALEEVAEAAVWTHDRVLSSGALSWLAKDVEKLAGRDPAVGERPLRQQLSESLRGGLVPGSRHHRRLTELTSLIRSGYLDRWAICLDGARRPAPERISRAVGSHLMDVGYSIGFLHRWARQLVERNATLGQMLEEAAAMAEASCVDFDVLVPFAMVPGSGTSLTSSQANWLPPGQVSSWLAKHGGRPSGVRQNGGFVFKVTAKDKYQAVEQVAVIVDRLVARASLVRGFDRPKPMEVAYVAGGGSVAMKARSRGAYVLSLRAEDRVYEVLRRTALDDALELAAGLNHGSPGPAITGGWAAVEALLVSSTDESDGRDGRGNVASERMAALVACSWPRSELTRLAHQHLPGERDATRVRLDSCATNRERSIVVADALTGGNELALSSASDQAAAARMSKMLAHPHATLGDVRTHVNSAMRRLYRQRNIVMHGGATGAVALDSALRTAAPLVGAGLDRIVHAAFADGTDALTLADRAHLRLRLVGGADGSHIAELLE